ncbi:MAG: hypothetical protein FWC71_03840 [Defluviitaleaceae bacterium]|nr:hypothetical protein [Defluviitaleaceae bacterium]
MKNNIEKTYTHDQLQEAHAALLSTLRKCEKIDMSKQAASQRALLQRRISALKIALDLIEREKSVGGNLQPTEK